MLGSEARDCNTSRRPKQGNGRAKGWLPELKLGPTYDRNRALLQAFREIEIFDEPAVGVDVRLSVAGDED
jgi:hypothetical protein